MTNKLNLEQILKQKYFYNMDGYKCHIIWYNEEVIVWKYYGVNKHHWFYECSSFSMFNYESDYNTPKLTELQKTRMTNFTGKKYDK